MVVYVRVMKYALLEMSELCSKQESVARSRKSRSGEMGESRKRSMSVVGGKEMVTWCSLQPAPETRLCTSST